MTDTFPASLVEPRSELKAAIGKLTDDIAEAQETKAKAEHAIKVTTPLLAQLKEWLAGLEDMSANYYDTAYPDLDEYPDV